METILKLECGGLPPTVNHLYRTSRSGARYKTPAAREWQERAAAVFRADYLRRGHTAPCADDAAVDILYLTRDRRKWDIDNRVKALLDCLQMSGVLKDDRQVKRLTVSRSEGQKTTATLITVRRITERNEKLD